MLRLSFQFSILLAFAPSAFSQATFPSPVLTSISPLGGKIGSLVELNLRGTDLDGPVAIMIGGRSISIRSALKAHVVLPADMPAGAYDLRFVGRYGVSNPRVFMVTPHTVVESSGTNAKADNALKITVGSGISGVFKATTSHWFTFEAQKSRTLTARFLGMEADTRAEVLGVISDTKGRELARVRQGVARFTPPADGAYRLEVHELMHRIGDEYGFFGMLEAEKPGVATSSGALPPDIKPGDVIHGSFPEKGRPCVFDFAFKKGDRVVIEVRSHQLGHATDPHLVIENLKADGTTTAHAEIADASAISPAPCMAVPMANRDPSYAFEARADGAFRISLSDTFATTLPFELRVTDGTPEKLPSLIALNAVLPKPANVKTYEIGTANVCRGGILALEVAAPNRNAFSAPVELKCDQTPAGLTCLGGFIGRGQSLGYIAFQAATDAPAGAALVGGIMKTAHVVFPVADANRDNLLTRIGGSPAIGVSTLDAPAIIKTEKTDIFEVDADAKLEIPLKVTRHAGFTGALKLKALGLIDRAKAPEADIPASAAAGKLMLDMKALKLAPGDYGFILQGPAKMKVRRGLGELHQAEINLKKALGDQKDAQQKLDAANADVTPKKVELVKMATGALKSADKARADADKLVKELTTKAAPKEATFIVYSNPIRIRVKEVAKK